MRLLTLSAHIRAHPLRRLAIQAKGYRVLVPIAYRCPLRVMRGYGGGGHATQYTCWRNTRHATGRTAASCSFSSSTSSSSPAAFCGSALALNAQRARNRDIDRGFKSNLSTAGDETCCPLWILYVVLQVQRMQCVRRGCREDTMALRGHTSSFSETHDERS